MANIRNVLILTKKDNFIGSVIQIVKNREVYYSSSHILPILQFIYRIFNRFTMIFEVLGSPVP